MSICDFCSTEIPEDETNACDACGGTFCNDHASTDDHKCEADDAE